MVELQLELMFSVRDRTGRMLPPEELHTQGELLMGALLDLEKCNDNMQDPATSSDTEAGAVTVDLSVTAATDAEAVACAMNICRTAIHAIGGSTPTWPADPNSVDTRVTDFTPRNVHFDYV
jgi:hypothetical protein